MADQLSRQSEGTYHQLQRVLIAPREIDAYRFRVLPGVPLVQGRRDRLVVIEDGVIETAAAS